MRAAVRNCSSHSADRLLKSTRPEVGVQPASDMFEVVSGGTVAA
jgi:hypothetical protein